MNDLVNADGHIDPFDYPEKNERDQEPDERDRIALSSLRLLEVDSSRMADGNQG
jgi:hypothetical protein